MGIYLILYFAFTLMYPNVTVTVHSFTRVLLHHVYDAFPCFDPLAIMLFRSLSRLALFTFFIRLVFVNFKFTAHGPVPFLQQNTTCNELSFAAGFLCL
ncbi:hypothetical protein V8C86DRAFT_2573331 [Haematococcus lacustris]